MIFHFMLALLMMLGDGRTMQANGSLLLDSSTYSGTTNPRDVVGVRALAMAFPATLFGAHFPMMNGDPCYPGELDWIQCNDDAIPRVIALNLGGKRLFARLPDFSSMDALQTIDLHENLLTGSIPEFFGSFPELTYLNLAGSGLTGPVPDSLSNNKKLKLIGPDSGTPCNSLLPGSCLQSPPTNTITTPPTSSSYPTPFVPSGPLFPTGNSRDTPHSPIPVIPTGQSYQPPLTPIPRQSNSQFPADNSGSAGNMNTNNKKNNKLAKLLGGIIGGIITPSALVSIVVAVLGKRRRQRNNTRPEQQVLGAAVL